MTPLGWPRPGPSSGGTQRSIRRCSVFRTSRVSRAGSAPRSVVLRTRIGSGSSRRSTAPFRGTCRPRSRGRDKTRVGSCSPICGNRSCACSHYSCSTAIVVKGSPRSSCGLRSRGQSNVARLGRSSTRTRTVRRRRRSTRRAWGTRRTSPATGSSSEGANGFPQAPGRHGRPTPYDADVDQRRALDDGPDCAAYDENVRLVVLLAPFAREDRDEVADLAVELCVRAPTLLLEHTAWYERFGE